MYITRLASNEIFSPSNKIYWEVGRAKDLSAPLYIYRRWEDNIKMDLQEVGGGCGDWMELAQDRDRWRTLVIAVRNLRVPKMRGIFLLAENWKH
jgi:hypothetical protein